VVYVTPAKSLSVIAAICSTRDYVFFRSHSALFRITSKTFKIVLQLRHSKILLYVPSPGKLQKDATNKY